VLLSGELFALVRASNYKLIKPNTVPFLFGTFLG